jgi:hypothetical protein
MATSPVMRWLADGVPITLLCDLAARRDPESLTISLNERPTGDLLRLEADLPLTAPALKLTAG